ncbi:Uncharacterised protein [Mycobacterium tuberculosis]|uniref:Uncharacterized protein n=1 Tax=Mycobacterium tuberculosis TaxID=1773 RepID=A0A654U6B8_MYCTX|nr:Uncharacterised protein [Mycobacterium tuberculosis]CNN25488.1 Uncharacterised protein [Mycobacterium tuberculosis]
MPRTTSKPPVPAAIRPVTPNTVTDWIAAATPSTSSSAPAIMVDLAMPLVNETTRYPLRVSVRNVISGGFNTLGSCRTEPAAPAAVAAALATVCAISGEPLSLANVSPAIGFSFSRAYLASPG